MGQLLGLQMFEGVSRNYKVQTYGAGPHFIKEGHQTGLLVCL